jgi:hypothetical protein
MWFEKNRDEGYWDAEKASHLWEALYLSNIRYTLSLYFRLHFLDF